MNLSNTSRYAIRILSFMAHQGKGRISAKYLVEQLDISDKYLRRIMTQLAQEGLIQSIQGREGGYVFNKPLESIYLIDILNAVESTDKYTGCILGFRECTSDNPCALHYTWNKTKKDTYSFLSTTTLADIAEGKHQLKY